MAADMRVPRIAALDAMRGIAALTVVLYHSLLTLPAFAPMYLHDPSTMGAVAFGLTHSPLHLLFAGHEAVVLFFIISGYVLALPYLGRSAPSYGAFVVKRGFRIYVAYVAVVTVCLVLSAISPAHTTTGFSDWFNAMWAQPPTWPQVVSYLLMINDQTHPINTAAWSLFH